MNETVNLETVKLEQQQQQQQQRFNDTSCCQQRVIYHTIRYDGWFALENWQQGASL